VAAKEGERAASRACHEWAAALPQYAGDLKHSKKTGGINCGGVIRISNGVFACKVHQKLEDHQHFLP
jgi:hypothetical protein